MRWSSFLLCCWPGLAALWLRGNLGALAVAVGWGALLNLVIVGTFVWPQGAGQELPAGVAPVAGWMLVLWLWVSGFTQSRTMFRAWATPPIDNASETTFRQAQTDYLRGQYVAAERALAELLAHRPADAEARLLLATILRRTQRKADAERELDALAQLPTAGRWARELALERQLVAATTEETGTEATVTATDDEPADDEVQVIAYERVERERQRRRRKAA